MKRRINTTYSSGSNKHVHTSQKNPTHMRVLLQFEIFTQPCIFTYKRGTKYPTYLHMIYSEPHRNLGHYSSSDISNSTILYKVRIKK